MWRAVPWEVWDLMLSTMREGGLELPVEVVEQDLDYLDYRISRGLLRCMPTTRRLAARWTWGRQRVRTYVKARTNQPTSNPLPTHLQPNSNPVAEGETLDIVEDQPNSNPVATQSQPTANHTRVGDKKNKKKKDNKNTYTEEMNRLWLHWRDLEVEGVPVHKRCRDTPPTSGTLCTRMRNALDEHGYQTVADYLAWAHTPAAQWQWQNQVWDIDPLLSPTVLQKGVRQMLQVPAGASGGGSLFDRLMDKRGEG